MFELHLTNRKAVKIRILLKIKFHANNSEGRQKIASGRLSRFRGIEPEPKSIKPIPDYGESDFI